MDEFISSLNIEHRRMTYNDIIEYIFRKNTTGKRILLRLDHLNSNKELFISCLDMFCKGLIYMHATNDNRVIINNLTQHDIQATIDRLSMTGILTIISMSKSTTTTDGSPSDSNSLALVEQQHSCIRNSLHNIESLADNEALHNFYFNLNVGTMVYNIRFKIVNL